MKLIIIFIIGCLGILSSCNNISAGSYGNAQIYKYEIQEDSLIKIIVNIKRTNPDLVPPVGLGLIDGKDDSTDYWYHVYFFNKEKNEVIHTWIRNENKEISNFAFVGINEGMILGNWKEINKDFNAKENQIKKDEFESLILNKINDPLLK